MQKVIIIRYAEIHLKGKNRGYFEHAFQVNIERAMKGIRHELHRTSGRYLLANFDETRTDEILERLSRIFGVHSYSQGLCVSNGLDEIYAAAKEVAPRTGSFKVVTHRAYKQYPMTSMEISAHIGGRLLADFPALKVDVHEPASTVCLDIRENGTALVFCTFEKGAGGMPVGTSGKGLLLISGGIDSPVAGYMMAKRGMSVELLHFHSYPYTNDGAKEKVKELSKILSKYSLSANLTTLNVAHIQEEIHKKCAKELNVTLLRRFMFRLAEKVAQDKNAKCLITGESLGQVASQTIEGITSSNAVVKLPVLRPLIGFDKDEIIEISKKIGTFETSILPFEDCCTVFLPDFPAIKPALSFIEEEEQKLDVPELIKEALATKEVFEL